MIRVLQIVDGMNYGGIQSFIMNVYRKIDRELIQFDFLLHNDYKDSYVNEIIKLGGQVFFVPPRNKNILANRKELKLFFKNHHYDIVHFHESSLSYLTPLVAAKKYGVKKRIIHSHSSMNDGGFLHGLLHKLNKKRIHKIATCFYACGDLAKEWMFSGTKCYSSVRIINNGIDLQKYSFDEKIRNAYRQTLNIPSDSFVIGHVGRFEEVKNHVFLIDIFNSFLKKKPNSFLVLVGDGSLLETIRKSTVDLGIANHVLLLGNRQDISNILQVFDIFILPSLFEGVPIALLEAEAAGLPCIISDSVSREVDLNTNLIFLPLSLGINAWVDAIINMDCSRIEDFQKTKWHKYSIDYVVEFLSNEYIR